MAMGQIREVPVIRIRLFGVLRTILEYIVFVMGGTAILFIFARGIGILWSYSRNPEFVHPGFRAAVASGLTEFYDVLVHTPRVVVWGVVVPQILSWILVAALLYVTALALAKVSSHMLVNRIALGVVSLYCSGRVILFFSPAQLHDLSSIYFAMFFAGLLGGVYGFSLSPRVRDESPRISPMLSGHWAIASAWIILFSTNWIHTEYQRFKIHSIKDPPLEIYFVKWAPAEGEVREQPVGEPIPDAHYLTELEIVELRAAGLTGTLTTCGAVNSYPPPSPETRRLVIVMSRPTRETIDLPKPALEDTLYLQTEQGWKIFPPSAPTVERTVRLSLSNSESHLNVLSTHYSVDIGLGHPLEIAPMNTNCSWLPGEFQMPLPSLPSQAVAETAP